MSFVRKRKSLVSVDQVLNRVVAKLGLDRRLKEHAFMGLWPLVVGDQFASKSRPIFIDSSGNLVVTVKDASVAQELSLMRMEVLKKLKSAARGVGVNVSGLRFDLKQFHSSAQSESETSAAIVEPKRPGPRPDELDAVQLTDDDFAQIAELKQSLGQEELAERILGVFEKELRLARWLADEDFPKCTSCQAHARYLHTEKQQCADCYYESISA